jgi:hypothetical protein
VLAPQHPPFPEGLPEAAGAIGALWDPDVALFQEREHVGLAHAPLAQREAHSDAGNAVVGTASSTGFVRPEAHVADDRPFSSPGSEPSLIGLADGSAASHIG